MRKLECIAPFPSSVACVLRLLLSRAGHRLAMLALASLLIPLLPGCDDAGAIVAGNPERGRALIRSNGCSSCHIIPGVSGADGLVGPPLTHMGRRIYIAGVRRNTPANMEAWLENPQAIVPGNVMPNMGLTPADAQDITAYLYQLR